MSIPTVINLNDTTPAAPAGFTNGKWQADTNDPRNVSVNFPAPNPVIGFVITSGVSGTDIAPHLTAAKAGQVTRCVVAVKSVDPSIGLAFRILQNGVNVFSSNPTVAAGTSPAIYTFSSLTSSPLSVSDNDLFTMDILTGSSLWVFGAQLKY